MDEIELLLSKWNDMNYKQKAFVLILGFGALAFALDQVLVFIEKWIIPNMPPIPQLPSWVASIISLIPFTYLLLIFLYTYITIVFIKLTRDKAEEKAIIDLTAAKESQKKAEQLLQSERDKFNVERDELMSDRQWLYDELAHKRDQTIQSGQKFYFNSDQRQNASYTGGGLIVDDRTFSEKRFGEIEVKLKKDKNG